MGGIGSREENERKEMGPWEVLFIPWIPLCVYIFLDQRAQRSRAALCERWFSLGSSSWPPPHPSASSGLGGKGCLQVLAPGCFPYSCPHLCRSPSLIFPQSLHLHEQSVYHQTQTNDLGGFCCCCCLFLVINTPKLLKWPHFSLFLSFTVSFPELFLSITSVILTCAPANPNTPESLSIQQPYTKKGPGFSFFSEYLYFKHKHREL